ncbi:MAG: hypothetical protein KC609_24510, partial [Myxococcales bacterium]|nr:hypothetical protein [Myxococcales bacterium]
HFPGARLFVARERGAVVGYAHHTPPFPLVLAQAADPVVDALGAKLRADRYAMTSVQGPLTVVERFVSAWPELASRIERVDRQGLYRLTEVTPAPSVGRLTLASREHLELLVRWHVAFCAELQLPEGGEEQARRVVEHRVAAKLYYLLVDGDDVVASAVITRTLPTGRAVGYVYTPTTRRRHGYASDLVAKLSATILAEGYQYCCLFTQLENDTSNRIYQNVGYRWLTEFRHLYFAPD